MSTVTKPTIHVQRGRNVTRRLLEALRDNTYPFNIGRLPQDQIPEEIRRDPLRHAQFIFYICHFMRGAIQSDIAIQQLVQLWRHKPRLFEPESAMRYTKSQIVEALSLVLDYHTEQIAGFWLENSKRLIARWRGDPRLIFKSSNSGSVIRRLLTNKEIKGEKPAQELFEHEWGFLGYQGKMASMLAYFLSYAKLITPVSITPAVDFHILRVLQATEVIRLPPDLLENGVRYDQVYPLGEQFLESICKSGEQTNVEVGDAYWLLSATLCRIAPGNVSVGRTKGGVRGPDGKKVIPQRLVVDPHNAEHLKRYEQSCHRCPVRTLCRFNIPSGPYYEVGRFMLYPRKTLKPSPALFAAGLHDAPVPRRLKAGVLISKKEEQLPLFPTTSASDP